MLTQAGDDDMVKLPISIERSHLIFVVSAALAFLLISRTHSGFDGNIALPGSPVKVATTAVNKLAKPIEIPMSGLTESRKAAVVSAPLSGRIVEVSVTDGQMVTAGQPLVTLQGMVPVSPSPAAASGSANAASPSNGGPQSQASYDNLVKEYERYQKLYQLGAVPRRQVEDLAARVEAARSALAAPAETPVQQFSAPADTANGTSVAMKEIVAPVEAPIAGKITQITAANEASVQTGQTLMVVDTGGEIRVVVRLDKQDLYLIHSGTKANITLSSLPNQLLTGQVEGIYPEIGTNTSAFRAYLRVDNTSGLLKAGLTVNVGFLMEEMVPVSVLPKEAVITDQGASYVYLAVNGKAVRQEVTLGSLVEGYREITSGLPDDAVVVTSNLNNLKDGTNLILE